MDADRFHRWLTLCANFAIIAGIIFLAMEVREARNATEMQMMDSHTDGFMSLNFSITNNSELARIFIVGLYNPDKLSDTEAIQFAMFLRAFHNQHKRSKHLNNLGLLSDSELEISTRQLAQIYSTPGGKLHYDNNSIGRSRELETALKPYMGEKIQDDYALGRDPKLVQ
jgi:hypothetical protein